VQREDPTGPVESGLDLEVSADFGAFFDLHFQKVFRAVLLMTRDRNEAEDVAQEAFVKVYERWDQVARMADPAGYLYRTALNERRSRLRRALRWRARSLYEGGEPDVTSAAAIASADVFRAMGRLTDDQRAAVVLVEYVGFEPAEAASLLGISAEAARSRLHRARLILRAELRADG
jgi:RNA polymerase sigma-70 factor (ECF subfamily)